MKNQKTITIVDEGKVYSISLLEIGEKSTICLGIIHMTSIRNTFCSSVGQGESREFTAMCFLGKEAVFYNGDKEILRIPETDGISTFGLKTDKEIISCVPPNSGFPSWKVVTASISKGNGGITADVDNIGLFPKGFSRQKEFDCVVFMEDVIGIV